MVPWVPGHPASTHQSQGSAWIHTLTVILQLALGVGIRKGLPCLEKRTDNERPDVRPPQGLAPASANCPHTLLCTSG